MRGPLPITVISPNDYLDLPRLGSPITIAQLQRTPFQLCHYSRSAIYSSATTSEQSGSGQYLSQIHCHNIFHHILSHLITVSDINNLPKIKKIVSVTFFYRYCS